MQKFPLENIVVMCRRQEFELQNERKIVDKLLGSRSLFHFLSKAFDFYAFQQEDVRSKEDWLGSSFSRSSKNKMVDAVLNKFLVTLTRFSGWK